MKISIKKSTFELTWSYWNYQNINFYYQKIKNLHLNFEFFSEVENSETEVSLKKFLKKTTIYSGNLHHEWLMLKVFLGIEEDFKSQFFLFKQP